ncbi:MAG: sodium/glutamate symporter [Planctomycetia bacterium]|nr:sodium/glutamate symporter [Planctomycetia bacterium]
MNAVISFCGLSLLLLIGKSLRIFIPFFRTLYLPSSVIGGGLGLLILTLFGDYIPDGWTVGWKEMPGFLINIVFATLFLGENLPKIKDIWNRAAPQVCFGQIVAWGQYAVGLLITVLLLAPMFQVPMMFGNLIEIGFEGGHGTVGGLSELFEKFNWAEGKDIGLTIATAGMVLGILVGTALINWAARRGHIEYIRKSDQSDRLKQLGFYPSEERPDAGKQTVFADSIDSLAFHLALVGFAVLGGVLIKQGLAFCDSIAPSSLQKLHILQSFPLFPLCMIGGILLQVIMSKLKRLNQFVDHGQMQRISGASLDFLVVSAIASIRLDFVLTHWMPLLILILVGTAWNVFCVLVIAPRLFKEAWFERAISDFGQSMGVTATGLLLLRTADPDNKTCAASSFGYKQIFHEPFMGGGIWTSLALPLVFTLGGWTVCFISLGAILFWLLFWLIFLK